MGTKLKPGAFDCYANAAPDEPMFVLLARDRHAPTLVREWARKREVEGEDAAKIAEARSCADAMEAWKSGESVRLPAAGTATRPDQPQPLNEDELLDAAGAFVRREGCSVGGFVGNHLRVGFMAGARWAATRPDPHGWQPIETAPRDRRVLIYCPSIYGAGQAREVFEAWWRSPYEGAPLAECWWCYDGDKTMLSADVHRSTKDGAPLGATRWMPLPSPSVSRPDPHPKDGE